MTLTTLDWSIIFAFFVISMAIGVLVSKQSGKSSSDFFLSGRSMPWWLLGFSMVATTFSADTPNLVTDIVRKNGVSGNWVWWAFLLTGMLTVFVYARLWRRSGVMTDLEFYELRYSGKGAAFLRGFRALYLGVFFNVLIMATVTLAAIKIGGILLGLTPTQTILIASIVTVFYSALGGLKGVILTDFFQFIIAMVGSVWAAYVVLNMPEVGGLTNLLEHENVAGKLHLLPDFNNMEVLIPLFILPLAVQWWSVWYPGAEPGGGGYIAQRMLSAKDEKNAVGATLFFNIAHYALRPWPWILIALGSLVMFPDIASLKLAFPNVDPGIVNDDLAYPAMLTYLPAGLLGLVIASLIAAFMSTISTHLNWGSSYIVNDFYKRFVDKDASEKKMVSVGRISTVILMALAAILALYLSNALQAFNILLQIGAGTGLIFILRWFWWRINAYSEIAAMVISFLVAIYFEFIHPVPVPDHWKLLMGVGITTVGWLTVTFLTQPDDYSKLLSFYKLIRPHSRGWKPVIDRALSENTITKKDITVGKLPGELAGMFSGVFLVYGSLFAIGFWIYGNIQGALIATGVALVSGYFMKQLLDKKNREA
ncbi:MAG: Na+:solute symporter [Saprospiraceae bacterium]|nr:Na+:solute symporter [Saprospiraceae bacterium]MCB9326073.1 Na+:solute symporter [Lewinellaceae bacterium]